VGQAFSLRGGFQPPPAHKAESASAIIVGERDGALERRKNHLRTIAAVARHRDLGIPVVNRRN
jgi:hypothetical protein